MSEGMSEELMPNVKLKGETIQLKHRTHSLTPGEARNFQENGQSELFTQESYDKFKNRMDKELLEKYGGDAKKMFVEESKIKYVTKVDGISAVAKFNQYFTDKLGLSLTEMVRLTKTAEQIATLKSELEAARAARLASTTAAKIASKLF